MLLASTTAGGYSLEVTTPEEAATESMQLQKIADKIGMGNIKGLEQWITKNIKYRADRTARDEWKEPRTTLADGTGDCEDFATLQLELLKKLGITEVFLLGVSRVGRNLGHVVCFFRVAKDSNWQYFDFEKLKQGPRSFKELRDWVARDCRYGSKIDYQLAKPDRTNLTRSEEASFGLDS